MRLMERRKVEEMDGDCHLLGFCNLSSNFTYLFWWLSVETTNVGVWVLMAVAYLWFLLSVTGSASV